MQLPPVSLVFNINAYLSRFFTKPMTVALESAHGHHYLGFKCFTIHKRIMTEAYCFVPNSIQRPDFDDACLDSRTGYKTES